MNKKYSFSYIRRASIFLGLIIYILSIYQCGLDQEEIISSHCSVEINGPYSAAFSTNEEITFTAHIESWDYPNGINGEKRGTLREVIWESSIDGELSKQTFNGGIETNHSFTTNALSPGNHVITCFSVVSGPLANSCSEEINIEIIETVDIRYPNCIIKLFTIDYYDTPLGPDTTINSSTFWGTASGTWQDTVFTATISEQDVLNNIVGKIEVTIDSKQENVLAFYGKETASGISSDYERVHICQGSGPIEIDYVDEFLVTFKLQGENVTSILQSYSDAATGTSNGSPWFKTLTGFSANSESLIVIEFDNYE